MRVRISPFPVFPIPLATTLAADRVHGRNRSASPMHALSTATGAENVRSNSSMSRCRTCGASLFLPSSSVFSVDRVDLVRRCSSSVPYLL